jgi:2-dehydro-3-deoxygalactonokinase
MVRVQREAFDAGAEIAKLREGDRRVGAVAVFIGTVRDVNDDAAVDTLTLEHYPGMTEKALARIVDEAKSRFDVYDIGVIHRIGELAPTDPIVFVGVTSAHRGDAFDACRFVMDYLKTQAPFWKKEKTSQGDWGTTSARAYAVDSSGHVSATRHGPLGVQQVRGADFAQALDRLLGDWAPLRVPRFAAGMIGSRQGWVEAPYLDCPAHLDGLGTHVVWTPGRELAIVPGLIYRDEQGVPDVMRGEETQLAGTLASEESFIAVLPGTHSKWVRVERRRVTAFQTFMTGEAFAVLMEHSILGRLAAPDATDAAPGSAFSAGVAHGSTQPGLLHATFGARTLALTGELAAHGVSDWLSGCLIGSEIASARRWLADRDVPVDTVRVIGNNALVERYTIALAGGGIRAVAGPEDAVVRGLIHIGRHAGIL